MNHPILFSVIIASTGLQGYMLLKACGIPKGDRATLRKILAESAWFALGGLCLYLVATSK